MAGWDGVGGRAWAGHGVRCGSFFSFQEAECDGGVGVGRDIIESRSQRGETLGFERGRSAPNRLQRLTRMRKSNIFEEAKGAWLLARHFLDAGGWMTEIESPGRKGQGRGCLHVRILYSFSRSEISWHRLIVLPKSPSLGGLFTNNAYILRYQNSETDTQHLSQKISEPNSIAC